MRLPRSMGSVLRVNLEWATAPSQMSWNWR
ncbi:hypothetical protein FHU35_12634 [Saccharopolyspora dendranthemae]|uniref:Uncharacterized protein n=1 Tax=Saccharopolyspora dendranthemae TaxID=1181886 RepID=A0A561U8D8_9PSEU|nr:hypothetical protein FHU35_12634 [Saccharopolyspora dendranthemae]